MGRVRGSIWAWALRLDLEDADGVALLDAAEDALVVEGDAGEVDHGAPAGVDQIEALLDQGEHAQAEEVDLDHPGVVDRVLVPVADVAVGPGGRLHRHALDQGVGGDDHAAHVLGEVAGEVVGVPGQLDQLPPAGGVDEGAELGGPLHLLLERAAGAVALAELGQAVELDRGQAQRLAQVADRASDPVAGDGGDQRRAVPPPALVHALDQPLPDVPGEVEVDVGKAVHLLVEEAAEEEPVADRVDVGEPDQVADQAAHAGAAAAARQAGWPAPAPTPP